MTPEEQMAALLDAAEEEELRDEAWLLILRLDELLERTEEIVALRQAKGAKNLVGASARDAIGWIGDEGDRLREMLDEHRAWAGGRR
jgi:hypothetical protein